MSRRVQAFRESAVGDDPDQALRYMEQLEENAAAALSRQAQTMLEHFDVKSVVETGATAKIGELIVLSGSAVVTLPLATRDNAGRPVGVAVLSGTATVKGLGQNINGAASFSLPSVDMRLFWSLGNQWMTEA